MDRRYSEACFRFCNTRVGGISEHVSKKKKHTSHLGFEAVLGVFFGDAAVVAAFFETELLLMEVPLLDWFFVTSFRASSKNWVDADGVA